MRSHFGGEHENIRLGFRILHLVSSDDLGMSRQFQQPQQRRGFFF
jgi:hypothetical protein